MDQDDPEKRIADLERQLAEQNRSAQPQGQQMSDVGGAGSEQPVRWQLTPMPSFWQSVKPRPAVAIDVGKDAIWVVNPETNAVIASAWLAQVIAAPAEFTKVSSQGDVWVGPTREYTQPLLVVDVPGMQSLIIGTPAMKGFLPPRFRFSWRGVAYPGKNPNYYLRDPDWLTLVEKFGLAGHLEDHDPSADQRYTSESPSTTGGSLTPEQVRNVAFAAAPPGKRGYNEDEVDAFLDLVEAALQDPTAHRLTAEQVRAVAFSTSPLGKRGYNQDEVDAFVDLVEAHTKSEQGMVAAPPQAGSAPPPNKRMPARHARPQTRISRITGDVTHVFGRIFRFAIDVITGSDV
jgi:DivIVA domain-containing protein